MAKQERKKYLINQLHGMGVFYNGDRYIEELTLGELEYYHIERKCEMVNVQIAQKGYPAEYRVARGKFIPVV